MRGHTIVVNGFISGYLVINEELLIDNPLNIRNYSR